MAISESKKKIVIDNYFKSECDVNTSIKEAFTKGFELGLKKVSIPQQETGHWDKKKGGSDNYYYECSKCGCLSPHNECADSIIWKKSNYCPDCGARMVEQESEDYVIISDDSEIEEDVDFPKFYDSCKKKKTVWE